MGGSYTRTGALTALLLAAAPGCFSPSEEAVARLEETKRTGDEILEQVGGLEERFLGNQANLFLWREMARRHKEVSAVTCQNLASHVTQMEQLQGKQEQKAQRMRPVRFVGGGATVSEVSRAVLTHGRN